MIVGGLVRGALDSWSILRRYIRFFPVMRSVVDSRLRNAIGMSWPDGLTRNFCSLALGREWAFHSGRGSPYFQTSLH